VLEVMQLILPAEVSTMFMHTVALVGIVLVSLFVLIAIAAAIAFFPDFLRYMKIRSSLWKGRQFTS
jgi:hypothetical protein